MKDRSFLPLQTTDSSADTVEEFIEIGLKAYFDSVPDELIWSFFYFLDPKSAFMLSLCSKRLFEIFSSIEENRCNLRKRFNDNKEEAIQFHDGIKEAIEFDEKKIDQQIDYLHMQNEFLSVVELALNALASYWSRSDYLLIHDRSEDYIKTKRSSCTWFAFDNSKGFHRANCFIHILGNQSISLDHKLFALYTLLRESNGCELKKKVNKEFAGNEALLQNAMTHVTSTFPSHVLEAMQEKLLNKIHHESYSHHYKSLGYAVKGAGEKTNQYWKTFFSDLKECENLLAVPQSNGPISYLKALCK